MNHNIFKCVSIRVILPIVSVAMLATLYVLAQENTGKKYALLVGVQEYGDGSGLRRLDYTENDVTDLAEVLKQQGYIVTMMTESEYKKTGMGFLLPDAKKIMTMFKRLAEDCKRDDTLLVALSGHGAHLKENNKLYFCPMDTNLEKTDSLLAIEDVMAIFSDKSCLAANKILLVDACRNAPPDGRPVGALIQMKSLTRPVVPEPPGGTVALFSCSKGEISHESLKQKRGFLFHHVIKGLSGEASNGRGEVTWSRLVTYVTEYLPLAVRNEKGPEVRQTPEAIGNSRGEIILARSGPRNAPMDQPVVRVDPKEITNSIGIKLMRIPKGKFMMGSPETEEQRKKYETQHEVTISQNFYMGSTEVTQAQWQKVMGNNPSKFKSDDLPVETISWYEAVDFCKRLSEMPEEKKAGRKYRLPTEAEWEYACRAGTTTPYHFGSQLNGRQANCDGTVPYGTDTKGPYLRETSAVGTYPANAWGLYDMHGNVLEWCSDWYGDYPSGSLTNPSGPATGSDRVYRGGSWSSVAVSCRSANSSGHVPSDRVSFLGFRVALSSSMDEVKVRHGQGSIDEATVRQDPKEITNSIGIKLMRINTGKFMMGSPETEKERWEDETQHEVTISQNFYMGATEVTQAQWQKVMGNNPSFSKGDDLPVEQISWEESVDFCKRLSEMPEEKKAGRKYRLPTEAEWEYACRAGTTTAFHFGSQLNGRQANCNGSKPYGTDSEGPYLKKATPAGKYQANAWGLYDMHGNVWEWCSDWQGDYPTGSVTDPIGPAMGLARVIRGGSWSSVAVLCRSARRYGCGPSNRPSALGFRVALSLPQPGRDPRVESDPFKAEGDFLEKMKQLAGIEELKREANIKDALKFASKAITPDDIVEADKSLKKQLDGLNNDPYMRENRRQQLESMIKSMMLQLDKNLAIAEIECLRLKNEVAAVLKAASKSNDSDAITSAKSKLIPLKISIRREMVFSKDEREKLLLQIDEMMRELDNRSN
jgi:formylglycine-generating enzyme required for sulfatase activity